jgi:Leucine-rich repeat (LRR) protein
MSTRVIHVEPSSKKTAGPRPLSAVNGALTETVVRSLWTQGGSDEYGIDAHRLNIQTIESFGKAQCSKVRELDLSFNQLVQLNCLHEIPSLRVLKVHANCLKELDDYDIPKSSNIEVLFLSGNQLSCIPKSIGTLRKLRELRLDSNRIVGIPIYDSMYSCRKLTYLNLSRNKITSVKGLESIGTLETLVLASNDIETLHPVLRRLDNLQDLDLSGNRIASLNPLRGIRKLSVLRVADNRISSWKEIPPISTLTEFHARSNRLTSAPPRPDDFPILDVLDIGDNRIDDMNSLTNIVRFSGLMSLRVEGNPVCREDHAIVQTLVNEMSELLVIDGIDASVYGGGNLDIVTPRSVLQAVERKNRGTKKGDQGKAAQNKSKSKTSSPSKGSPNSLSKRSPNKRSPKNAKGSPKSQSQRTSPSSGSKTSESFTLSIANLMTGYNTSKLPSGAKQRSSSSQSASRPSIVPNLHVAKSQAGTNYGLRRPLSARGTGPMSPRNTRRTGLAMSSIGGNNSATSGLNELDLSAFGRPVARAGSLRTGRGTGLKRLEDVEDMARTFRKTIASERNILITCAPNADDEKKNTEEDEDKQLESVRGVGGTGGQKDTETEGKRGDTRNERREKEKEREGKMADKTSHQPSRATSRSKRQHRSLKAALEYSRKGEDTRALEGKSGGGRSSLDESTGANDCNDGTVLSPTNSEYSRSTVTDASPSPNGSEGTSSARMLEEISSARGHRNKDKEKEEAAVSQIRTDSQVQNSGWSSRPSSAAQSRGRTGGPNSSSTARRKKGRRGFGAFRVPKGAKHFVHSTLDAAEGSIEGEEMGKERKVV